MKKTIYSILGLVLISSFCFSSVWAADFRMDKKWGNTTLGAEETTKNLYTVGNAISINGDVDKSLYVAGNIITISGDVEGNVFVAGNTIVIRGDVGDSVHIAGGNIIIESDIEEDLFLGGGNVTISAGASIGGDLVMAGGTVNIEGDVAGDLLLAGGQAIINGSIGGEVKAKVDDLKIGPKASIASDFAYWSAKEATIDEEAQIVGEIVFKESGRMSGMTKVDTSKAVGIVLGILTLAFLAKVLMGIAVGLFLIYVFKGITEKVVKESLSYFWPNCGRGFAALILTPVAILIALITLVGAWLAGLVGMAYILMVSLSCAFASIVFGSWLIKVFGKKDKYSINWKTVVTGVAALKLIMIIPFIGWLVGLFFMLVSLGALCRVMCQTLICEK